MTRSLSLCLCLVAVVACLVGCQGEEDVTQYTAPKRTENRIIGAIVPRGEKTWFFKMVGPSRATAQHKKEFLTFLDSVRFSDGKPTWTVPANWRQDDKGSDARFATFFIGSGANVIELSVSMLGGDTFENIKRWSKQLDMPPLTPADFKEVAEPRPVDGEAAIVVDLVGPGSGKTIIPPFAGAHGGHP
jgi:hypothetical protein